MSNVYIIGDKDYLIHHGIKGQKWGVENGPPYPLNSDISTGHSLRKVRRYQKQNAKWAKNASKKELEDNIDKVVTKEQIKILQQKYDKFNKARDEYDKFLKSEEYKKFVQDAYDQTYKWLEKNDPDYLKNIISKNNGNKTNLNIYHDFDKIMDGYMDESSSKFDNKLSVINEANAFRDYVNYSKSIVNGIVGKYGNKTYNHYNDLYNTIDKQTISSKIDSAISSKYLWK